ncbi:MAG: hypothetical protein ACOC26_03220 [Halochromatium sp.]
MTLKLPKTYTLLLAICAVAGPFIWLVLTEDGKRRSDLFLLHLLGHQPFNLAMENLRPGLDQDDLLGQFSRVAFDCGEGAHALGARRCAARIGSFNGIPARRVELYWQADGDAGEDGGNGAALNAVRLDYRGRWHALLVAELKTRHGEPRRDRVGERTVLAWRFAAGTLLIPQTLGDDETPSLMWVARQA